MMPRFLDAKDVPTGEGIECAGFSNPVGPTSLAVTMHALPAPGRFCRLP
jgi:hypothetical protein